MAIKQKCGGVIWLAVKVGVELRKLETMHRNRDTWLSREEKFDIVNIDSCVAFLVIGLSTAACLLASNRSSISSLMADLFHLHTVAFRNI